MKNPILYLVVCLNLLIPVVGNGQIWKTELYGWQFWVHEDSELDREDIPAIIADLEKSM